MNPSVPSFRPTRAAAADAGAKISEMTENEMEEVLTYEVIEAIDEVNCLNHEQPPSRHAL